MKPRKPPPRPANPERDELLRRLALLEVPRLEREIDRALAVYRGPRIDVGARRRVTTAMHEEIERQTRELLRTTYAEAVTAIAHDAAQLALQRKRRRNETNHRRELARIERAGGAPSAP